MAPLVQTVSLPGCVPGASISVLRFATVVTSTPDEVAGGCDEVFAFDDYDEWADCLLHFASAVFAFACAYVAAVFDACEFFVEA